MATRSSGGTRLLSKEYLTKNATPRNSASPPTHAKPFTPMNCSQLMGGLVLMRWNWRRFLRLGVANTGGGVAAGGRGGVTTGCGVMTGFGGATGAGAITSGCAGDARADSAGFGGSFSRFNRMISHSSWSSRLESSLIHMLCAVGAAYQPDRQRNRSTENHQDEKCDAGFHSFISTGDGTWVRAVCVSLQAVGKPQTAARASGYILIVGDVTIVGSWRLGSSPPRRLASKLHRQARSRKKRSLDPLTAAIPGPFSGAEQCWITHKMSGLPGAAKPL